MKLGILQGLINIITSVIDKYIDGNTGTHETLTERYSMSHVWGHAGVLWDGTEQYRYFSYNGVETQVAMRFWEKHQRAVDAAQADVWMDVFQIEQLNLEIKGVQAFRWKKYSSCDGRKY